MASRSSQRLLSACALIGGLVLADASYAVRYTVIDLGTLGVSSGARVLNDKGQVAGINTYADGGSQGFLWSDGVMTNLPAPGAPVPGRPTYADVGGINDSGVVVGTTIGLPTGSYQATVWSGGAATSLSPGAVTDSFGEGINNAGVIVGALGSAVATYDGSWAISPLLPGMYSNSYNGGGAINDRGWYVAGIYGSPGTPECGCSSASGSYLFKDGEVINLGLLPGTNFVASQAINSDGLVTGYAASVNPQTHAPEDHAFYYDLNGAGLVDMGGFLGGQSEGLGINDLGQIVGTGGIASTGAELTAFLWQQGSYRNLNDLIPADSGWTLNLASDINNVGQIAGEGLIGGVQHAFLLNPLSEAPEPASWAMMVVGFGAVGVALRRRPRGALSAGRLRVDRAIDG